MDDDRSSTPRRGRSRRRKWRRRAVNTPTSASRATERTAPRTTPALDGGQPLASIVVPELLTSREEGEVRRGPYEGSYSIGESYSISRGYEAE